ncbi:MAG: c-type cytochrome [Gallionella sp.]|nr:c-type cytochrome [Gallionella sp.]
MKFKILLALVAIFALTGCNKTDESAKTKAEIEQVYKKSAEAAATKVPTVGNTQNGELLAKQCAKCHGMDGVAANSGAPFIAGLEQNYMVSAMLAYKDGSRKNSDMKLAVSKIKAEEIADVSSYYANLKTPWKGEHVGMSKKTLIPLDKASIEAGAFIAESCNSCHGPNGNSEEYGITPSLAAMPPEYFIYSLKTYLNGKRKNVPMGIYRASLSDENIRHLAAYYAVQTPRILHKPQKGSYQEGELASADCAGCHGVDGNSLNPEIPHLAGQPSEYLVKAMKDYRDGIRKEQLMSEAMHGMSESRIVNIAAYYAQQKPESALKRQQVKLKTFDPIAEGEKIASSCNACHGPGGNSLKLDVPSLSGLGIRYFVAAATAYRDGTRKHAVMEKVVSQLSDSDFERAGFYYGLQPPVSHKKPTGYDHAAGEKLSKECVSCHGKEGISTDSRTPSLAGQDAAYLAEATRAYARGERLSDAMKSPAEVLKPQDIINVTGYFASLPPARPDNNIPAQPQVSIVAKCDRCHGDNGNSTERGIPTIAGQSEAYLALALKEYQDGRRKDKYMNAMSDVLSLVEMKAIAAYYAKQERK